MSKLTEDSRTAVQVVFEIKYVRQIIFGKIVKN